MTPPGRAHRARPTVRLECFGWVARELGLGERGVATLELPLEAGLTVGALLARLAAESEAFARLVYDRERGYLREYVALLLNDRMVELVGGLEARLQPGDRLLLLPGFSGGSPG